MSTGTTEVCTGVNTIVVLGGLCSVKVVEGVDGLSKNVDVEFGAGVDVAGLQLSWRPVSEKGLLQLLHAKPLYDRIYSNQELYNEHLCINTDHFY